MPADGFNFRIEGLEELDRMLRQLPKTIARSTLRKALEKAAIPIRDEAKREAETISTYSDFAESILIRSRLKANQRRRRRPGKDVVEIYVGSTAPHAHLIEFGTQERYRKKSGGGTGVMPANPFLTRAWEAKRKEALDRLTETLGQELEKAAARLRKRAEKGTLSKKAVEELLK